MIEVLRERTTVPVEYLCKHFGESSSRYYELRSGLEGRRLKSKKEICGAIEEIFELTKETYGSPRMTDELRDRGYSVSENTVAKYMKELGLDARLKKRFRVQTTDSNHEDTIAQRLFKVEDESPLPDAPGELLAGDITYLKLGTGFMYLAVVIDLYNREVVGWSLGRSLETSLVLNALDMAMRKLGPGVEVIFHSDRGSQYASKAYRDFLKNKNVKPSMSRKGNCYDNAYVESWFGSLKKEWIYRQSYNSEAQLRALVFEYIEIWYNKKRKHSSLGNVSPVEYKNSNFAL
mgnify:CR=1 FL=1